MNSGQDTNVNDLPSDVMIDILLKVEAANPLPLRCVSKWWDSLIVHPHFMGTNIFKSAREVFSVLDDALDEFSDFRLKYLTDNVLRNQENGPDDEEICRVMKAFDEFGIVWTTVEVLCEEEEIRNRGDTTIDLINHMLVIVIHLKENFINMRDIMQNVEDKIRCFQNCCRILHKSIASSSSSS